MSILDVKKLEELRSDDLHSLIDNKVQEDRRLEFKSQLPNNSDRDKKEFLADVSSFANAAGGHLVYGIEEEHGIATALPGVIAENVDAVLLRLENILRDGIQPRITGVRLQTVEVDSENIAIVIQIPRSWAMPHMVTFSDHSKFYSRNSRGKYALDVTELRAAFASSQSALEYIRKFRNERLAKIDSGETPVLLSDSPKIVLHMVPVSAIDRSFQADIDATIKRGVLLRPLAANGISSRFNFDGFLTYFRLSSSIVSYAQFFRNGIIETVDASLLSGQGFGKQIPSVLCEREILDAVSSYLETQKIAGISPPIVIFASLLHVKGYEMGTHLKHPRLGHPIDRDVLIVPEVLVEELNANVQTTMKPVFDAIWNAAGWPGCGNFKDGIWTGK